MKICIIVPLLQIPLWKIGGDSHHHFQKWWLQVTTVTYKVVPMSSGDGPKLHWLRFIVDLLYNMLYNKYTTNPQYLDDVKMLDSSLYHNVSNKSTTNRSSGVWAINRLRVASCDAIMSANPENVVEVKGYKALNVSGDWCNVGRTRKPGKRMFDVWSQQASASSHFRLDEWGPHRVRNADTYTLL